MPVLEFLEPPARRQTSDVELFLDCHGQTEQGMALAAGQHGNSGVGSGARPIEVGPLVKGRCLGAPTRRLLQLSLWPRLAMAINHPPLQIARHSDLHNDVR